MTTAGSTDESASAEELGEKVLYYYPQDVALETQLRHIGMCEALIDFHWYAMPA